MGLTLVQKIVELHGGTVAAHSEGVGRGSEFVVRLPRSSDGHAAACAADDREPLCEEARQLRILVVDDNRDAAESMAILLELWGHDVVRVYDGPHAIESSVSYRPDVVFLDIGLPGMDGYAVAGRLRERPETARSVLIAVTGYGQEEDRRRSRRAGFDRHLVKPVDPQSLQALLASVQQGLRSEGI